MDDGLNLLQFERESTHGRLRKAFTGAYSYLPDYHARSLTAQCVASGGANSCGRANFGQSDFGTPGCRIKKPTAVDLALARAAVSAFDLVLVVEQFDLQGPSLLLQRTVGVPNLWLGHARTNTRKHPPPPAVVLARLRAENAADAALHAFATELSNAALTALAVDLEREHGPSLGGFDPFQRIAAMDGTEGRRRCLEECRHTYANRGVEARYKRKCCKVCYAMHPSERELADGAATLSRAQGDVLLEAVKVEFGKDMLKHKVLEEQARDVASTEVSHGDGDEGNIVDGDDADANSSGDFATDSRPSNEERNEIEPSVKQPNPKVRLGRISERTLRQRKKRAIIA